MVIITTVVYRNNNVNSLLKRTLRHSNNNP